ncbi:MAG: SOS response-associated peptidase [Eubacteriaceae bacterium]
MCGRFFYHIDIIQQIELMGNLGLEKMTEEKFNRDIYPTEKAWVIYGKKEEINAIEMKWGFTRGNKQGNIINARSETVFQKFTFSESIRFRRCVIPCKGFYEWDILKNKIKFELKGESPMFMAGIWKEFENEKRFVILTTASNSSVSEIHDRMPLLIKKELIDEWITNNLLTQGFLKEKPPELKKNLTNIQESFSFLKSSSLK